MRIRLKILSSDIKFTFHKITKVKYVIFYETLSKEIIKYILPEKSQVAVFDPNQVNLNLSIFFLFFKNLFLLKNSELSFFKFVFLCYQYSHLELINPSKIITFIDNSSIFQWFARNYNLADFFAIQNGYRSKRELTEKFINNSTNLFSFGFNEELQFKKFGHSYENFIPAGSFLAAIFDRMPAKYNLNYDIALVSQHKVSVLSSPEGEYLKSIDKLLSRYIRENKKIRFCILCRYKTSSHEGKIEHSYFRKVYGDEVNLITRDVSQFSTYSGMKESKLIISMYSTSAFEAMLWGKKILFCDFSPHNIYANLKKGIWLMNQNNYKIFSSNIDKILHMPHRDYKKITSQYFNFLMYKNEKQDTIDKISSFLK